MLSKKSKSVFGRPQTEEGEEEKSSHEGDSTNGKSNEGNLAQNHAQSDRATGDGNDGKSTLGEGRDDSRLSDTDGSGDNQESASMHSVPSQEEDDSSRRKMSATAIPKKASHETPRKDDDGDVAGKKNSANDPKEKAPERRQDGVAAQSRKRALKLVLLPDSSEREDGDAVIISREGNREDNQMQQQQQQEEALQARKTSVEENIPTDNGNGSENDVEDGDMSISDYSDNDNTLGSHVNKESSKETVQEVNEEEQAADLETDAIAAKFENDLFNLVDQTIELSHQWKTRFLSTFLDLHDDDDDERERPENKEGKEESNPDLMDRTTNSKIDDVTVDNDNERIPPDESSHHQNCPSIVHNLDKCEGIDANDVTTSDTGIERTEVRTRAGISSNSDDCGGCDQIDENGCNQGIADDDDAMDIGKPLNSKNGKDDRDDAETVGKSVDEMVLGGSKSNSTLDALEEVTANRDAMIDSEKIGCKNIAARSNEAKAAGKESPILKMNEDMNGDGDMQLDDNDTRSDKENIDRSVPNAMAARSQVGAVAENEASSNKKESNKLLREKEKQKKKRKRAGGERNRKLSEGSQNSVNSKRRRKDGPGGMTDAPWTKEEERLYAKGVEACGENEWGQIATKYVTSRSPHQIRQYARSLLVQRSIRAKQQQQQEKEQGISIGMNLEVDRNNRFSREGRKSSTTGGNSDNSHENVLPEPANRNNKGDDTDQESDQYDNDNDCESSADDDAIPAFLTCCKCCMVFTDTQKAWDHERNCTITSSEVQDKGTVFEDKISLIKSIISLHSQKGRFANEEDMIFFRPGLSPMPCGMG